MGGFRLKFWNLPFFVLKENLIQKQGRIALKIFSVLILYPPIPRYFGTENEIRSIQKGYHRLNS